MISMRLEMVKALWNEGVEITVAEEGPQWHHKLYVEFRQIGVGRIV